MVKANPAQQVAYEAGLLEAKRLVLDAASEAYSRGEPREVVEALEGVVPLIDAARLKSEQWRLESQ